MSVAYDAAQGNDDSSACKISSDANFVAFESFAGNLVEDDTNGSCDVFAVGRGPGGKTLYVNDDVLGGEDPAGLCTAVGNDANDGLTPATPLRNIRTAVAALVDTYIYMGSEANIWADAGTYVENVVINADHNGLTLRGADASYTIVDGNQAGTVLYLDNFATGTVSGLTLMNGRGFTGAGIFMRGSSPTIEACTISGNSANGNGGGIYCTSASSPTMENCTINGNSAANRGGGIYCSSNSTPTLTEVIITGNLAGTSGGGIFAGGSSPSIEASEFYANTANVYGGAMYLSAGASPSVVNSTISGNSAGQAGGGAYCRDGSSPTFHHCTITGNKTISDFGDGGGVYGRDASPYLKSSILWYNEAFNGPQMALTGASTGHVLYSDLEGGRQDVYKGDSSTLSWGYGNIEDEPAFTTPGSWADTVWTEGDYHLTMASPCIDAAYGYGAPAAPERDKDGYLRYDVKGVSPDVSGSATQPADMGAYEMQGPRNVTVLSSPIDGVEITGSPAGTTPYEVELPAETVVTLTAPEMVTIGGKFYPFVRWVLDDVPQQLNDEELEFTIVSQHVAKAIYWVGAKNIIVLVGNGMGYEHIQAASYYLHGTAGTQYYEAFDLHYHLTTDSADGHADTAASATALSTGYKTHDGVVGKDAVGAIVKHVLERGKELRKTTGIVTSTPLSHVASAGFIAHNNSAANYNEIAQEIIVNSRLDVLLACGNPEYDGSGVARGGGAEDYTYIGEQIWDGLINGGDDFDLDDDGTYETVPADSDGDGLPDPWYLRRGRNDILALMEGETPRRIAAIPEVWRTLQYGRSGDLYADTYDVPLLDTVPTLEEMTLCALNAMEEDRDGFLLVIEGGAVDWGSVDNASGRVIEEMIDFNRASDVVYEWVEGESNWAETLVIVTSTHETGALVTDWNIAGEMPPMAWGSTEPTLTKVPMYANGDPRSMIELYIEGKVGDVPFMGNDSLGDALFDILGVGVTVASDGIKDVPITGSPLEFLTDQTKSVWYGTTISLVAPASQIREDRGYTFRRWILDGEYQPLDKTDIEFEVFEDTVAVAVYVINTYLLSVSTPPLEGVQITGTHPGISPYGYFLESDTPVSLDCPAEVTSDERTYPFVCWVLDWVPQTLGETHIEFTMDGSHTCKAIYQAGAKNVIVMVGDGMGFSHQDAAGLYENGVIGGQLYESGFDISDFRVRVGGVLRDGYFATATYSAGGSYPGVPATDTAAAATALSTANKTHNGILGLDAELNEVEHLIERAEYLGKATGVVSSVPLTYATPAGFIVHNTSRTDYGGIGREMLIGSAVDVIMGCGNPAFDGDGAEYPSEDSNVYTYIARLLWDGLLNGGDDFDLDDDGTYETAVGDADEDGVPDSWTLLQSRTEIQDLMDGATPSRVIAVPEVSGTLQFYRSGDADADPFVVPLTDSVPTVEEMTMAALNTLDEDPEGFLLVINAGDVDWASRANKGGRMIEQHIDFNKAVEAVYEWAEGNSAWRDTLILVVGSHETGGLGGLAGHGAGTMPDMTWGGDAPTNALTPLYAQGYASAMFYVHCDTMEMAPRFAVYADNTEVGAMSHEAMGYRLDVTSTPVEGVTITGTHGSVTNYVTNGLPEETVTLVAPPTFIDGVTGYSFARWVFNGEAQTEGEMTLAVQLEEDSTAVAHYVSGDWTLSVQSTPPKGLSITGTHAGTTDYTYGVNDGEAVDLTAPGGHTDGDTEYSFNRWTLDGVDQALGVQTINFTVNADRTAEAIYSIGDRTISVQSTPIDGIDITGTPAGTTNYGAMLADGAAISLTAPLEEPRGTQIYTFVRWILNGVDQPLDQLTLAFNLDQTSTAVATYEGPDWTLHVQSEPFLDVPITGSHPGDTNYSEWLYNGDAVSLTAPLSHRGRAFVQWQDEVGTMLTDLPTLAFSINSHRTVVALYAGLFVVQHGIADVDSTWTTVELTGDFLDPVIIAGPSTVNDAEPGVVRIRNVTADSFEIRFQEWNYLDGAHGTESIHWIAAERGNWSPGGDRVVVGARDVDGLHFYAPTRENFPTAFDTAPVVVAQIQTHNGWDAVTERISGIDTAGFSVAMQEEQAGSYHPTETVGYIAVEQDLALLGSYSVTVGKTAAVVTHRPFMVPAGGFIVWVEEEQSADAEIGHWLGESVGYIALAGQPPVVADMQSANGADPCTIRCSALSGTFKMATGTSSVGSQWVTVVLSEQFSDPVVVLSPPTLEGLEPGVLRVRGVSATSFQVKFQEWLYTPNPWHPTEKVRWLVVERGVWDLGDGRLLVADKYPLGSTNVVAPPFIPLPGDFTEAPVIVAQQQTSNGWDTVTQRLSDIQSGGFRAALQEEEAGGSHGLETLGYVAIGAGTGGIPAGTVNITAGTAAPSGWEIVVEEEKSVDDEVDHAAETIGVFMLGDAEPGTLPFVATMQTTNDTDPAALRCRRTVVLWLGMSNNDNGGPITDQILGLAPGRGEPVQAIVTGLQPVRIAVAPGCNITVEAPMSVSVGEDEWFAFLRWEVDGKPAPTDETSLDLTMKSGHKAIALYVPLEPAAPPE